MRICIVGGFGYLGSIIADMLHCGGHKVSIIDDCIWDNEDVQKQFPSLIRFEDLASMESNEYKPDLIIWAANVDINDFYSFCGEAYLQEQKKKIEMLAIKYRFINCSSYLLSYNNIKNTFMGDYFHSIEETVRRFSRINIRIPSLHGPSLRMRWDTCANELYFSSVVQNQIVLQNDWLTQIPLCGVKDMASYIISVAVNYDTIAQDLKDESSLDHCSDKYNLLEMAHLISSLFEEPIKVVAVEVSEAIPIFRYKKCMVKNYQTFIESMKMIKTNMQKNNLPDFTNDKYNNELVVRSARVSKNLLRCIGE